MRRQQGRYSDMYKRYKGIRDDFKASDFDRDDGDGSGRDAFGDSIFDALFGDGDSSSGFSDDFGPKQGPYSSPADDDDYFSRSTRDRPWRRGWGIRNRPPPDGASSGGRGGDQRSGSRPPSRKPWR